jgi:hypothetical protein
MKHKNIVIIQTPVYAKSFTQVTCLMSDDELAAAKLERPDLVFMLAKDMPKDEVQQQEEQLSLPGLREDQGITVKGMTLPANIDEMIEKVLEGK